MNQTVILFPASCAIVTEDEMVYLDGGAQVVPTITSVFTGVTSFVAAFCGVVWDSLKSCARSFVEITLDDLRNPNFQAVALTVSALAIVSCLMR